MRVRERKGEIECARERGRVDERDSEREYEIESARQSTRERESGRVDDERDSE